MHRYYDYFIELCKHKTIVICIAITQTSRQGVVKSRDLYCKILSNYHVTQVPPLLGLCYWIPMAESVGMTAIAYSRYP